MTIATTDNVRTRVDGHLGCIRLNRPRKINALTADMVGAVTVALRDWESDDSIAAVLIDGAGDRGLCAGGDLADVYAAIEATVGAPDMFWHDEYLMDLQIARYPKPVVTVMDGIVFGGGVGISAHASHRVVTETSRIAMPETAIGLSPDVGAMYLLARAPGRIGTHAALTGARLGAGDAIAAGLADRYVRRDRLATMAARLARCTDRGDVDAALDAVASPAPPAPIAAQRGRWLDECYAGDDAAVMLARLASHSDPAARQAAVTLAAMSPTAVKVALRALRNAASMDLPAVFEQDRMLCNAFLAHPDFAEGIRARIVDKDRHPTWHPATLDEVSREQVDAFFRS